MKWIQNHNQHWTHFRPNKLLNVAFFFYTSFGGAFIGCGTYIFCGSGGFWTFVIMGFLGWFGETIGCTFGAVGGCFVAYYAFHALSKSKFIYFFWITGDFAGCISFLCDGPGPNKALMFGSLFWGGGCIGACLTTSGSFFGAVYPPNIFKNPAFFCSWTTGSFFLTTLGVISALGIEALLSPPKSPFPSGFLLNASSAFDL